MFDQIHFQSVTFNAASNTVTAARQLEKSGLLAKSQPLANFYQKHASEVDFSLKGPGKMLFPFPVSPYACKHLFYFQVFGLLDAAPGYFTRRQNYDSFLLVYTYAGSGILEYQGETYRLNEGTGFLIDCRLPHCYYTSGEHWHISMLHFNGFRAPWYYDQLSKKRPFLFTDRTNHTLQQDLETLLLSVQSSTPYRETRVSLLLEQMLLNLLENTSGGRRSDPDYIFYLQKYMENHFTRPFTLDDLASFASVSKYHLSREFKKHTGFSPNEYLISLRMDRAKFLLKNSNLPIEQVAAISGFSSYPNFLKTFKKKEGTTPLQYRS